MEIYLRVQDDIVIGAKYFAVGCGVTVAAGSVLTEMLLGRQLDDCIGIQVEQVRQQLEGVPPDRMSSVEVVIGALKSALTSSGRIGSSPAVGKA